MSSGKSEPWRPWWKDLAGGKIVKIGEMMGIQPDYLIHRGICLSGSARKFGVSRFLEVVDEEEEVVP